jgi:hypothetical protein
MPFAKVAKTHQGIFQTVASILCQSPRNFFRRLPTHAKANFPEGGQYPLKDLLLGCIIAYKRVTFFSGI